MSNNMLKFERLLFGFCKDHCSLIFRFPHFGLEKVAKHDLTSALLRIVFYEYWETFLEPETDHRR